MIDRPQLNDNNDNKTDHKGKWIVFLTTIPALIATTLLLINIYLSSDSHSIACSLGKCRINENIKNLFYPFAVPVFIVSIILCCINLSRIFTSTLSFEEERINRKGEILINIFPILFYILMELFQPL
jgi:hypothetical protein